MKKGLIIAGVVIFLGAAVILGIRFFSGEDNWICQNGEWVMHGNPRLEKPTVGCGDAIKNNNQPEEQAERTQPIEEPNIVVFSPKENATVGSPFDVEGKGIAFENMIGVRLKDENGKILFQDSIYVNSPDAGQYGLFQKEIKYSTAQTEGTLEVFASSMKDGADINKVIIPIKFGNEQSQ